MRSHAIDPTRTARVLEFLQTYHARHGWMPSYEEIQEGLQLPSKSSVPYQLARLERAGLIERGPRGASRCIRLTIPKE